MSIKRKLKDKWADVLLGEFTPHDIALGIALGTFIALLPTFGFSVLIAILVVFLFPHINRPAIFLAIMIWNPIVQIPIYAMSYYLGGMLYEGLPIVKYNIEILNQLYTFTRRFLVAHLIVTTICTSIIYAFSYILVAYLYRKKILVE